jgi:hypothetical protein
MGLSFGSSRKPLNKSQGFLDKTLNTLMGYEEYG